MFKKIMLYWLLFAITITATLDISDRLKKPMYKIAKRMNKHGLKLPCCGHFIKTRSHKIKNYKEVIISSKSIISCLFFFNLN